MESLLKDRFERFVAFIPFHPCYEWVGGYRGGKGDKYGQFTLNGKPNYAHRVSWLIYRGQIPNGLFVCHRCDNPRCVRIDHLFLGTFSDNMKDMHAKGRAHYNRIPIPYHKRNKAKMNEYRRGWRARRRAAGLDPK